MFSKNLSRRIISAFAMLPLVIGAIYWNPWTYFCLFCLIMLMTILEFYTLLGQVAYNPFKLWGTLSGLSIYTVLFLHIKDLIGPSYLYLFFFVFFHLSDSYLRKKYTATF